MADGGRTVDEIAGEVFGDAVPSIERYVDILTTRGVEWGLMGPKEAPRIWGRHIFNSAALSTLVPDGCQVADVGSGAGLPGIPLAIARPDIRITLIEPLLRRSNFLTGVVEELGLGDRVDVLRGRAEDVGQHFDIVTARAVAKLPTLIRWTRGLIGKGGELLALKGVSAQEELDNAQKVLKKYHLAGEVLVVRAHPDTEVTHVVRITKQ
jgi:16S rRNA (guanine527-N7)-methyltransferase